MGLNDINLIILINFATDVTCLNETLTVGDKLFGVIKPYLNIYLRT